MFNVAVSDLSKLEIVRREASCAKLQGRPRVQLKVRSLAGLGLGLGLEEGARVRVKRRG